MGLIDLRHLPSRLIRVLKTGIRMRLYRAGTGRLGVEAFSFGLRRGFGYCGTLSFGRILDFACDRNRRVGPNQSKRSPKSAKGHILVSRTCTTLGSSPRGWAKAAFDSPPSTKTCLPNAAMACPLRPEGAGPIFWNIYHRRSKVPCRIPEIRLLGVLNGMCSLDILKAAKSPRSFPLTSLPPKMYIVSSTRAAACPSRGTGIYPMHCNSDQVLVWRS